MCICTYVYICDSPVICCHTLPNAFCLSDTFTGCTRVATTTRLDLSTFPTSQHLMPNRSDGLCGLYGFYLPLRLGTTKRLSHNNLLLFSVILMISCSPNNRNIPAFSLTLAFQRSNELYKTISIPFMRQYFNVPSCNILFCRNGFLLPRIQHDHMVVALVSSMWQHWDKSWTRLCRRQHYWQQHSVSNFLRITLNYTPLNYSKSNTENGHYSKRSRGIRRSCFFFPESWLDHDINISDI